MQRKYIKWIVIMAFLPLLYLWGKSLLRDANLTLSQDKSQKKWTIEGAEAVRIIGEDTWNITAANVVRDLPTDRMRKIYAEILGPSGLRTINSPRGEYNDKAGRLVLHNAYGIWNRMDGPLDWKTPLARWYRKGDRWVFPKGVTVVSETYHVTGAKATFSRQSKVHLTNGCVRWWTN